MELNLYMMQEFYLSNYRVEEVLSYIRPKIKKPGPYDKDIITYEECSRHQDNGQHSKLISQS